MAVPISPRIRVTCLQKVSKIIAMMSLMRGKRRANFFVVVDSFRVIYIVRNANKV